MLLPLYVVFYVPTQALKIEVKEKLNAVNYVDPASADSTAQNRW